MKSKSEPLPTGEAKITRNFKKQRETSKRGLSSQYENTETAWSFYLGDAMTYSDQIQFVDTFGRKRKAMVNFNKVQQNIDTVAGFFAQNRREAKYLAHVPKDQGQQVYSKNMNALKDYHRGITHADQLEYDQDTDMLVNGYGAIDTDLSYIIGNASSMPNGDIIKKKLDPSCCYWDPSAKGKNLLDARWAGYWEDYELMDALDLFEGSDKDDFEQVSEDDPSDTGYVFNPYGGIYDKIKMDNTVEWAASESDMVRVYNHQWMEYETFYRADNPLYTVTDPLDAMFIKLKLDAIKSEIKLPGDTQSEDMFAFDPLAETLVFDEKTKQKLVKELDIEAISFKRKVFYTAVISGKHVFTWFKSVCQNGFSIKFKTGTYSRTGKMWMGMVNPMMEPAKYYNKALTELMFTIASNSKGGVYVEDDAVDDVADFETKYAKTDSVIVVNSGAISGQKIQDKARPALPTGIEGIIQLSDANISANGVDPSFMGQLDKDDSSGILFKRRIKQVLSKLAKYDDSITLYQEEDARLMADLIRVWVENNQGQWVRITGPDGEEDFMRIIEDMLAPQYDVTIQEASQSTEEKQETGAMLGNIGQQFLAVQDGTTAKMFYAEALQFMRLDGDIKSRLTQALQPQQQIDPAQFQQMQQQLQTLQQYIQSGQLDKTKSETEKNLATAAKTMKEAKVSEADLPLRHAQTVKTLEEARKTSVEAHTQPSN